MAEEVSEDRGLESEARKAVQVDRGNKKVPQVVDEGQTIAQVPKSPEGPTMSIQKVGKAQISSPSCNHNNLLSPSFFDISHLFPSPVPSTPSPPPTISNINQRVCQFWP